LPQLCPVCHSAGISTCEGAREGHVRHLLLRPPRWAPVRVRLVAPLGVRHLAGEGQRLVPSSAIATHVGWPALSSRLEGAPRRWPRASSRDVYVRSCTDSNAPCMTRDPRTILAGGGLAFAFPDGEPLPPGDSFTRTISMEVPGEDISDFRALSLAFPLGCLSSCHSVTPGP